MIKCGCDPHLPNTRMETALQLAAKIDGVVFSYMIRREIVEEMNTLKHKGVVSEIAKQVEKHVFSNDAIDRELTQPSPRKKKKARRKKIRKLFQK